jgi:RsiW-degrading membrane proteinase PrsW (M82 family)
MEKAKSIPDKHTLMTEEEKKIVPPGLNSRVAASIIIVFAWLIYAIVHVVFLWERFSTIQNIAMLIISFLLGVAILGAMWTSWGIKISREYASSEED